MLFLAGLHGTRQEEMIDHRLTDREWAEEWKHLDHVRNVCILFSSIYITTFKFKISEKCLLTLSIDYENLQPSPMPAYSLERSSHLLY